MTSTDHGTEHAADAGTAGAAGARGRQALRLARRGGRDLPERER
jgi:hypothetical protein